jgi:hypothetical protein
MFNAGANSRCCLHLLVIKLGAPPFPENPFVPVTRCISPQLTDCATVTALEILSLDERVCKSAKKLSLALRK